MDGILHIVLMSVLAALKKERTKWVRMRGDFLSSFSFQVPFPAENVTFMTGKEDRVC